MVEPEMAFCDLNDNMDLAEDFVKAVISPTCWSTAGTTWSSSPSSSTRPSSPSLETIVAEPFVRLPYTEAVDILKRCGRSFEFPVEFGTDLQTEHERYLTEEHFKQPVILYDYPREIKPFYMRAERRRPDGARRWTCWCRGSARSSAAASARSDSTCWSAACTSPG